MKTFTEPVIGIVGGMGPEAGLDLMNHINTSTLARKDQDHLSVLLASFPADIHDRTDFLEGRVKTNPAYAIASIVRKLEYAGANLIALACNTSHVPEIYDVILRELFRYDSKVSLLHMPEETCKVIRQGEKDIQKVGIISTNGTYRAGIYETALRTMELTPVVPDPVFQDEVIHAMIYHPDYGIKSTPGRIAPRALACLEQVLDFFEQEGAEAIILGCTELSLILPRDKARNMIIFNSNKCMAQALVRRVNELKVKDLV